MAYISKIGASFRTYFFDLFPQAALFCNSVSQEFGISPNLVHEAVLIEINAVMKQDDPDASIDDHIVDEALRFCKIVLENSVYVFMFDSFEEFLRSVLMFRRSALFFSVLHNARGEEGSLLGADGLLLSRLLKE